MILAIDTSLAATSACLLAPGGSKPVASESVLMGGGHAEALLPLLDRVVSRAEGGFGAITRVAVTIGPGSFTGIRIGVAAGRAIGLACKVSVVGVSTLAALAAPDMALGTSPSVIAAIDARHGAVFVQGFGQTLFGPALLPAGEAAGMLGAAPVKLVGSGAQIVAVAATALGFVAEVDGAALVPDIAFVARLGALASPDRALPRPLYLKAPDARPPVSSALLGGP